MFAVDVGQFLKQVIPPFLDIVLIIFWQACFDHTNFFHINCYFIIPIFSLVQPISPFFPECVFIRKIIHIFNLLISKLSNLGIVWIVFRQAFFDHSHFFHIDSYFFVPIFGLVEPLSSFFPKCALFFWSKHIFNFINYQI